MMVGSGTAGVQQTATSLTTAGVPQVTAPPVMVLRAPKKSTKRPEKLSCRWCHHLGNFRTKEDLKLHKKTCHETIYECSWCHAGIVKSEIWRHMQDVHHKGLGRNMKKIRRKYPANINNEEQSIPNGEPSMGSSYDKVQPLFEEGPPSGDEEHLSLEGQLSSEDEQRPTPEAGVVRPALDHQQSFSCGLCPTSFPSVELLIMHTKFVHCLTCGYCVGLPAFFSVFLWREYFATVHGVVV